MHLQNPNSIQTKRSLSLLKLLCIIPLLVLCNTTHVTAASNSETEPLLLNSAQGLRAMNDLEQGGDVPPEPLLTEDSFPSTLFEVPDSSAANRAYQDIGLYIEFQNTGSDADTRAAILKDAIDAKICTNDADLEAGLLGRADQATSGDGPLVTYFTTVKRQIGELISLARQLFGQSDVLNQSIESLRLANSTLTKENANLKKQIKNRNWGLGIGIPLALGIGGGIGIVATYYIMHRV